MSYETETRRISQVIVITRHEFLESEWSHDELTYREICWRVRLVLRAGGGE